jgi:hypothetical protein
MPTIIDSYVHQHTELTKFLSISNEISLKSDADRGFTKVLILACASYFEDRILQIISDYSSSVTEGNELILSFIRTKGLERQYHTFFDWKENNANKFFAYFGEETKTKHKTDIKQSNELQHWEQDFMFLGRTRNILVHSNFASVSIEETYEEIYEKFKNAIKFIEYIENIFTLGT